MLAREELAQQERSLSTLIHSASGMAFCVLFAKGASQANAANNSRFTIQHMCNAFRSCALHNHLARQLRNHSFAAFEPNPCPIHRDTDDRCLEGPTGSNAGFVSPPAPRVWKRRANSIERDLRGMTFVIPRFCVWSKTAKSGWIQALSSCFVSQTCFPAIRPQNSTPSTHGFRAWIKVRRLEWSHWP